MTASRIVCIALAGVIGSFVSAHAALLGVAPGLPTMLFNNQGVTTYDSATDLFVVAGATPVAIRFTPFGLPVLVLPTGNPATEAVSIRIHVDQSGAFTGGVAEADLVVIGQVDQNGDSIPEFSGVLLTGEAVAFGFQETSGATGIFDFRFEVTGGAMASEFGGGAIGVTLSSEHSNFPGNFTLSFAGVAKGNIGPIAFRCGDGFVDPGEQCDDGNAVNTDCCTNTCTLPRCGDGIVTTTCPGSNEQCDDGNDVNDDLCTNACTPPGTPCDDLDPCTEDLCVCAHDDHDGNSAASGDNGGGGVIQVCVCPTTPCHDDGDDDHHDGSVAKKDHPGDGDDDDDDDDGNGQTCKCVHRPICSGACCPDCDDGNPCTEDTCGPGAGHDGHDDDVHGSVAKNNHPGGGDDDDGDGQSCVCRHQLISSCCLTDAGCNDKDACTRDQCIDHRCVRTPVVPCCGDKTVDAPETCDPPGSKQHNGKVCRSDCTYCGDERRNGSEECDAPDMGSCSSVAKDDPHGCASDCTCVAGGEGCTPGYWKNHASVWDGVGTNDKTATIKTSNLFNAKFGVTGSHSGVADCMTLRAALRLPNTTNSCGKVGSPSNELLALDRHAAAALASADSGINYPYTVAQVIALYRDAVGAVAGPETISSAHKKLSDANELGCPF